MKLTQLSQFNQRLIVSVIVAFVFFWAVYLSYSSVFGFVLVLLIAAFQGLALKEYYQLSETRGFEPLTSLGIGAAVAYIFATYLSILFPSLEFLPVTVLLTSLTLFFLFFFRGGTQPLSNLAVTVFGLAYLTLPLTFAVNINYFPFPGGSQDGRWWLIYLFAITKVTDMGAYFVGKSIGKRPLAPKISPKKTVEGAIGGLVCAVVVSVIFGITASQFSPMPIHLTLGQSIWLGILCSVAAQFGDLAESLLKRDAEVKDSSHLPGLGGFLDIVDSIVFTTPLLYLFIKYQFS